MVQTKDNEARSSWLQTTPFSRLHWDHFNSYFVSWDLECLDEPIPCEEIERSE